ncbi:MAG: DNA replication/repair protein RecF [Actinomyces sp.]|nr:DNA replication/repair protein RecF [Actinomyces sp.]MDN6429418.1 DNA replication/repair protein RecF [Propionibacterium sp.]MDN6793609.1 DNA replication/repair protein RecF [Propionibacterium sp.]
MRVSHVALDDFRSYRHAVVELPRGTTVLVGRNGQGKTNLVEAIAYLSAFSSHRVAAEGALVRLPSNGEDAPAGAVIRVRLVSREHREDSDPREQVIELEIVRGRANRARLNRTVLRPREIVGMVRTVVFAPEDLQLVRGDPSVRRHFLDDLATQLRPTLSALRSDFERVARQRGALMKQASARMRRGMAPDLSTLEVWDQQFATLSAQLTSARFELVDRLRDPVARAYAKVSDSPRELSMSLESSVDRILGVPSGEQEQEQAGAQVQRVLDALARVREREVERGVNLVGAHRDELVLDLGGMPVKGYASHGESWSVALSLRLGAFAVLEEDGEEPILILDDVFAELDAQRRAGLAEMVSGADQVLVTAAVADDVPSSLQGHRLEVRADAQAGSVVSDA